MGEIRKQGIYNTAISYTGIFFGFLYALVLQPIILSPQELGLTRFLISVSVIFGTVFPIGLVSFTIRYFPRFRDKDAGHNGYLRFILVTAISMYVFFCLLVLLFKPLILSWYDNAPMIVEYMAYTLPISLCLGFVSLLNVYCSGLFKTSVPAFLNEVFLRILNILVLCAYYIKLIDFHFFIVLYTGCFILSLLLLFLYVLRIDKEGLKTPVNWEFFKKQDTKDMLNYLFLLAPASVASISLRQIDIAMLGSDLSTTSPLASVAIYTIAFTIGSFIEVPANALSKIADVKVSDAIFRKDKRLIEEIYFKSTRLLMAVGGGIFVVIVINVHSILSFLPSHYQAGNNVVLIIAISSFLNMATGMNTALVFYSDYYKKGAFMLIGLLAVSLLLNYFLIPPLGVEGAAIATGSALLLFNVLKTVVIYRKYDLQPFRKFTFIILFFMFLGVVAMHILPRLESKVFDIFLRSTVAMILYVFGMVYFKIVPEISSLIFRKR